MDVKCVFIDALLLYRGDSSTIALPGCQKKLAILFRSNSECGITAGNGLTGKLSRQIF